MHMEPQPKWRAVCLHMGVLIDNRPRRARAGAARKRAASWPWLSAGGKKNATKPAHAVLLESARQRMSEISCKPAQTVAGLASAR